MKDELNPCGKALYADEKSALEHINLIKNKSTRSTIPIRPYFCIPCNGWHITSKADKYDQYLNKIKELELKVEELQKEINRLANSKLTSQEKIAIRADDRLKELKKRNQVLNEEIRKCKSDNNTLIMKNIALEKKLK